MTSNARALGSLITQSWLHAGRIMIRWRREPAAVLSTVILPVCLLVVYKALLGEQIHKVTGVDSIYGLVPMCAVLAGMFGALGGAVGIPMERSSGLLSRMWVLPVHRASAIAGRLTAEAARALLGTIFITAVGAAMGLRFTHGWHTALAYILIPPLVVVGFTALVMTLAVRSNGRAIVTYVATGITSLVFISSGITPIGLFPEWLQPVVRVQPMSPPIEVMRALAHEGPLLLPLALTFGWAVTLIAVFIPLAVRGYRVAAECSA
ncbi:ABC transporter permease [Mycobacterium riyadhense]|uniref:ABC transporter permease n=1 Tax=Mycobacterium riyadhense TaxID=486698 RepID=UPI00195255F3|nr:ABC transporter permease [Mycobacterium riyadhense]